MRGSSLHDRDTEGDVVYLNTASLGCAIVRPWDIVHRAPPGFSASQCGAAAGRMGIRAGDQVHFRARLDRAAFARDLDDCAQKRPNGRRLRPEVGESAPVGARGETCEDRGWQKVSKRRESLNSNIDETHPCAD